MTSSSWALGQAWHLPSPPEAPWPHCVLAKESNCLPGLFTHCGLTYAFTRCLFSFLLVLCHMLS